jgi:hypothetical protein
LNKFSFKESWRIMPLERLGEIKAIKRPTYGYLLICVPSRSPPYLQRLIHGAVTLLDLPRFQGRKASPKENW